MFVKLALIELFFMIFVVLHQCYVVRVVIFEYDIVVVWINTKSLE